MRRVTRKSHGVQWSAQSTVAQSSFFYSIDKKKNKGTGELFLVVFFRASRESEQIGVETSTEREHSLLTGLRYSLANAQADRAVCHLRRRSSSS